MDPEKTKSHQSGFHLENCPSGGNLGNLDFNWGGGGGRGGNDG